MTKVVKIVMIFANFGSLEILIKMNIDNAPAMRKNLIASTTGFLKVYSQLSDDHSGIRPNPTRSAKKPINSNNIVMALISVIP